MTRKTHIDQARQALLQARETVQFAANRMASAGRLNLQPELDSIFVRLGILSDQVKQIYELETRDEERD